MDLEKDFQDKDSNPLKNIDHKLTHLIILFRVSVFMLGLVIASLLLIILRLKLG